MSNASHFPSPLLVLAVQWNATASPFVSDDMRGKRRQEYVSNEVDPAATLSAKLLQQNWLFGQVFWLPAYGLEAAPTHCAFPSRWDSGRAF